MFNFFCIYPFLINHITWHFLKICFRALKFYWHFNSFQIKIHFHTKEPSTNITLYNLKCPLSVCFISKPLLLHSLKTTSHWTLRQHEYVAYVINRTERSKIRIICVQFASQTVKQYCGESVKNCFLGHCPLPCTSSFYSYTKTMSYRS